MIPEFVAALCPTLTSPPFRNRLLIGSHASQSCFSWVCSSGWATGTPRPPPGWTVKRVTAPPLRQRMHGPCLSTSVEGSHGWFPHGCCVVCHVCQSQVYCPVRQCKFSKSTCLKSLHWWSFLCRCCCRCIQQSLVAVSSPPPPTSAFPSPSPVCMSQVKSLRVLVPPVIHQLYVCPQLCQRANAGRQRVAGVCETCLRPCGLFVLRGHGGRR